MDLNIETEWVYSSNRPCLPCFAYRQLKDGCVHLTLNSSWKFHQLAAGQLLSGQPVLFRQAGVTNQTCRVTLFQPARKAAVLGQPSRLRPHCFRTHSYIYVTRPASTACPQKERYKKGPAWRQTYVKHSWENIPNLQTRALKRNLNLSRWVKNTHSSHE